MSSVLINIDVPDLQAALAFYQAAFELKIGRRFGESGVELLGLQAPIYLLEKKEGTLPFAGAAAARDYARHWCPVHLDIVVEDIAVAHERVLRAGAKLESPMKDNSWGKISMYSDPFGHGLCLLQFSAAGYDAIATR